MMRFALFLTLFFTSCMLDQEETRLVDQIHYDINLSSLPNDIDWTKLEVYYTVSAPGVSIANTVTGAQVNTQTKVLQIDFQSPAGQAVAVSYQISYDGFVIGAAADQFSTSNADVGVGPATQWNQNALQLAFPSSLKAGLWWKAAISGKQAEIGTMNGEWVPFIDGNGSTVSPSTFSDSEIKEQGRLNAILSIANTANPWAGLLLTWSEMSLNKNTDLSASAGFCLTYQSTKPLRLNVEQANLPDGRAFGLYLPPQPDSITIGVPFSSLSLEGWETELQTLTFNPEQVTGFKFLYKGSVSNWFRPSANEVSIYQLGADQSCFSGLPALSNLNLRILRERNQGILDTVVQSLKIPVGRQIQITAPKPPSVLNQCFLRWEGSGVPYLNDPTMEIPTLSMPTTDVNLEAINVPCTP